MSLTGTRLGSLGMLALLALCRLGQAEALVVVTTGLTEGQITAIRHEAAAGDPQAQTLVGTWSLSGVNGSNRNYGEAAEWFRKAAKQGNPWATFELGTLYEFGKSVPRNHARAVEMIRRGTPVFPSVALSIGLTYRDGSGRSPTTNWPFVVDRDVARAVQWLRLCYADRTDNHFVDAARALGELYQSDSPVRDVGEALNWYEIAAGNGDAAAMFDIGKMYATGEGVSQDYLLAAFWYRLGSQSNEPAATYELARLYEQGLGVNRDPGSALELYHRQSDYADALARMTSILSEKLGSWGDDQEAVARNREQAAAGSPWGRIALGLRYERGLGVRQSVLTAVALYRVAANTTDTEAQPTPDLDWHGPGYFEDANDSEYVRQLTQALCRPGNFLEALDNSVRNPPIESKAVLIGP